MSETRTVTSVQARKSLLKAFKKQRPLFLWGPPGIGKSELVADTDNRAALFHDSADGFPIHFNNLVVNQSLVAFTNGVDVNPHRNPGTDHRPDRCVHSLGISAAGHYADCPFYFRSHYNTC